MSIRKLSVKEFEEILFKEFVDVEDVKCEIRSLGGEYIGKVFEVIVSPLTASMDIYIEEGFYSLYASDLINYEFEEYDDIIELRAEIKEQSVVVVWNKHKQ